ncbi:MAG: nucleotidyl transferase AbiEii/AbiGii toxin family protein [Desulfobacteraceae bacterium]|nr:nucleotidyl transferase AbiEii/AbiGii toxin family protein [Desulfobacteraceae bacterium]MBC2749226.1 nucleotidyl transferase AbiEii/AbiGii toxin family protein [Desulfobacteraceae bacterium]
MQETYYIDKLYPFQDEILKIIEDLALDFYLTGGTALGRCYLNHRYSDDLDFFVNDNDNFKAECNAAINAFKDRWACDIAATSGTFARIFLKTGDITLKVDFVNDVPDHYGEIKKFPLFHRIDSWQNILSNKLCALSRLEVKDIVDIVFIAKNYSFDWETIVGEARTKDLWIDPIENCRIIDQFPIERLSTIKWTQAPNTEEFNQQLKTVHLDIFNGRENSLKA